MNLRRAAALALVGWYLMLPPNQPLPPYAPLTNVPLSRWSISSAYDAADDCNAAQNAVVTKGNRERPKQKYGSVDWGVSVALVYAQCVATDDPRLKEK